MTVLFTGPSPRDASAYMRITQGESSPRLDPEIPDPLIPKGCIPRMISIWGSPSQAHQDHQGHQGHGGQANGGAAEIRVCGMKNVTACERQNGFKSLWTPVREKQTFSKASPSNSVGKRFQWIVEQLEPQRPSRLWERSWIACQSASKYIFWHPIRIISFGAAFGSNAEWQFF